MRELRILWGQRLRRDRWQLAIWVLGIGALTLFAASAIQQTYGEESSRAEILQVAIATPAILMLRGLPRDASLGGFTFFLIYAFLALLAGLMSTFLAVRHYPGRRGNRERRADRRHSRRPPAPLRWQPSCTAQLPTSWWRSPCSAVSRRRGLTREGSLLAGAATGAVGLAFLGVGLLVAQLMGTSRGAQRYSPGWWSWRTSCGASATPAGPRVPTGCP